MRISYWGSYVCSSDLVWNPWPSCVQAPEPKEPVACVPSSPVTATVTEPVKAEPSVALTIWAHIVWLAVLRFMSGRPYHYVGTARPCGLEAPAPTTLGVVNPDLYEVDTPGSSAASVVVRYEELRAEGGCPDIGVADAAIAPEISSAALGIVGARSPYRRFGLVARRAVRGVEQSRRQHHVGIASEGIQPDLYAVDRGALGNVRGCKAEQIGRAHV